MAPKIPKKVFILEDIPALAKMTADVLEKSGFAVDNAANSDEAWVKLQKGLPPDCVILDAMVPGTVDGIALCARLRQDGRFAKTRLIVLTALQHAQLPAMAAGCDVFLLKPYKIPELIRAIDG